ncbi:MAG TPA: ABC transporter substrate-binding protein, partial [Rugosimonospora sp.]|nr:ABC transporter substrate-binding protein [Rugosimonospora sp.]
MDGRLSRRTLLRIAGGLAVTGAAGCARQRATGQPAHRQVRMRWWGGQARSTAYQQAVAEYQRRHPAVTVVTQHSGYDGYFDAFDVQVAAGSAPDLLQMDTALVAEYVGRGELHPLDEYLGKGLDLGGFPDALLSTGRVGSRLYGVPSGTGGTLVTYDRTVLRQARVDPPPAEWTWADLRPYAAKLTKALGGRVYGSSDGGGDDEGALQIFLRQRRKDLFTRDGTLGYDAADLTEWLTFWDAMRRDRAAAPGAVTSAAHNDATKNPLIVGATAMTFGSGLEISLPTLTSHELDFVPAPQGPPGSVEGQYLSGGVLLCGFARSPVLRDSVDIIDFFANDEAAIRIMGITRGIPPTAKARAVAAAQLNPAQQRALAATDVVARRVA